MDSIPQKRCSKCKQHFPATLEYFRKASKEKSGLTSRCKSCLDEWYENNKGREWTSELLVDNPTRACTKCKRMFPATPEYFRRNTINKIGLSVLCKECSATNDAIYLDEHREESKEKSKERYHAKSDLYKQYKKDNAEKIAQQKREWREKNPDKTKKHKQDSAKRHPESHKRRINRYNERHPEVARLRGRVSAMKRRVTTDMTKRSDLLQMYEDQNELCAYCGINIYWTIPHDIHVDHIKPLVKGGTNDLDNLCLACADCNYSKGDLMLSDWIATRGW